MTRQTTLKVKTGLKAGRIIRNHSGPALKVRTAVKAGKLGINHTRGGLAVRAGLKAGTLGKLATNHNRVAL